MYLDAGRLAVPGGGDLSGFAPGWQCGMNRRMKKDQVIWVTLSEINLRTPLPGLIHHSDRADTARHVSVYESQ